MCRLYGFRAAVPGDARRALLEAPNALVKQSCRDSFGETHADGWGLGWYEDGLPVVERGTAPAAEDPAFAATARRARGRTVVAHVRAASVGNRSLGNTHPFTHGRWLFAHNGTVTAFGQVGPTLERETESALLACRRGTTDSELIFSWLLGRMIRAGIHLERPVNVRRLGELVGAAVADLAGRCDRAGATEAPGLNLLLTDGDVLVATRWGRSLSWLAEGGAVHVASEPPWPGSWQEVPKQSLLTVDPGLQVSLAR